MLRRCESAELAELTYFTPSIGWSARRTARVLCRARPPSVPRTAQAIPASGSSGATEVRISFIFDPARNAVLRRITAWLAGAWAIGWPVLSNVVAG